MTSSNFQILVFSTKGADSNEEARILKLLDNFCIYRFPFQAKNKFKSFLELLNVASQKKPNLIVMEGTGIAGGLACLLLRFFLKIPYVVSSGDAVAPFISLKYPVLKVIASLYEQILCRCCAGFIGWTPYLVGRALTFGASKGVTAAGWSLYTSSPEQQAIYRTSVRERLGIPQDAIVFGLVGSLMWMPRFQYCYGAELIHAFKNIQRQEVCILVVGNGEGFPHLQALAKDALNKRIFLTGNVAVNQVLEYLAAMDVVSLPQSVDEVGSFRYTTKLSEYWAAKLPVLTNQIPAAYDILQDWCWRLPGTTPWDKNYINALAQLMESITPESILLKKQKIPTQLLDFDLENQIIKVTNFINDLIN